MLDYIYCDKVGAGPDNPKKRWGLFSTELTEVEARTRYELNAANRDRWFGIVRLDGSGQPASYLQIYPRANGVVLHKINQHRTIDVGYIWSGYYHSEDESIPYAGSDESVFLGQITWYSYLNEGKHLRRNQSTGHITMQFREDGYAKEEVVTSHGFGNPDDVEIREYQGVDVSANWFKIPEFGDWGRFFDPESALGQLQLS
ncbi:hypothetical protein J2Y69_000087 [Microbacterium resistens]|uniref:Uncharacterized protein n=1 Tax=Microbacterium resistens TaxID=156977 RepID=A0ABU1S7C2_9MICO|nr:hypothetical protein [Microbacterium resistens]MDR6865505.1 hypothetical protein [Microbacterium resistens]